MTIGFITQQIPYGKGEGFVLVELEEFVRCHGDIVVIPVRPAETTFHQVSASLLDSTLRLPLLSVTLVFRLVKFAIGHLPALCTFMSMLQKSRKYPILLKNLLVLPKAIYVASQVQRLNIDHLHAYWASTSATVAMVAAQLTGIPWSLTAYRWDIAEDNLLALKYQSATFFRCPDEQGQQEIAAICGLEHPDKCRLIRSGVPVPHQVHQALIAGTVPEERCFRMAMPAMFVEKKGHRYLVEALRYIVDNGRRFECWLVGDGPLREEVAERTHELGLDAYVVFKGLMRLTEMYAMYQEGQVDVVVLPCIVTDDQEKEGIPVSLVDALANGLPVISTTTGSIPELLREGAGILVAPKDPAALAEAIERLMVSPDLRRQLSAAGRQRVLAEYAVDRVVAQIMRQINVHRPVTSASTGLAAYRLKG
jgi:colanic acid/amylovoran biosynthesis glycosyltransferase